MAEVTLKKLKNRNDWWAIRQIKLRPEQRKYGAPVILSWFQSTTAAVTSYSIHLDDKLIGFVMLIQSTNPVQWIIERLLIDADYQRQGYGYQVTDMLIDMIYEKENSEMVVVRYDTDNEAARSLFKKLNFEEQEKLYRKRNIALLEFEFEESEEDELDEDDDDFDDELDDDEDDWDDEDDDLADDDTPDADDSSSDDTSDNTD